MIRPLLALLSIAALASFAAAQGRDDGPEVAKGLPAPRTANDHIDFSGIYHAPGYGPGDPPIREGRLCLPSGTPLSDPYTWKIVQKPQLSLILYEGNVHDYRQIFLDGRPHEPRPGLIW